MVSPDGRDGSLQIGQDVEVYRARLDAGTAHTLALHRPRAWVQVIHGTLDVNDTRLLPGDGAALVGWEALALRASEDVEALVFDLR